MQPHDPGRESSAVDPAKILRALVLWSMAGLTLAAPRVVVVELVEVLYPDDPVTERAFDAALDLLLDEESTASDMRTGSPVVFDAARDEFSIIPDLLDVNERVDQPIPHAIWDVALKHLVALRHQEGSDPDSHAVSDGQFQRLARVAGAARRPARLREALGALAE